MGVKIIKTNLKDLDEIIGGLYPGEIMAIGESPYIGTTAFLATLIKKITWENGTTGLLFCLKNTIAEFQEYLISSISGISKSKISNRSLNLNNEELQICRSVYRAITDLPLIINTSINNYPYNTIDMLCSLSRDLFHKNGIEIIYIDSLESLYNNNTFGHRVPEIFMILKKMALELKIPIVFTWQSFVEDNWNPSDVDVCLLLKRKRMRDNFMPRYYFAKIKVVKNNYGNTGEIKLRFMPEFQCFETLPSYLKEIIECR